jgi:hypothetical protein
MGEKVSPGIYFVKLETNGCGVTGKIILVD